MPDRPLNATAASLLGFLHDGPMTGWDLVTVAEQRIGSFWSLTQSQVYRELSRHGRRRTGAAGERGRRDRQPYEDHRGRPGRLRGVGRAPPGRGDHPVPPAAHHALRPAPAGGPSWRRSWRITGPRTPNGSPAT